MKQALVSRTISRTCARLALAPLMAVMLSMTGLPAMVAAQTPTPTPIAPAPALPSPGLANPLDRNPLNRSGVPDSAPVMQDIRDSSTRPTLPAAPASPDVRDADKQPPDKTRDAQLPPPDLVPVKP